MNIHLKTYGQGKPLVFFHGWGFDSQIFINLVPALQSAYQVILVDLPGFGLTTLMDWTCFKEQLLKQLPQYFVLVGWSMGGLYATRLAIEASERVLALFNVASSPRFIEEVQWPGVSQTVFETFYTNLSNDFSKTLKDFVVLQAKKKIEFELERIPSKKALEEGLILLNSWDLRPELATLKAPTAFLFGRLDPITSVKIMERMQHLYPNFNYYLFNKSAHMPFISHQEAFIETLKGFIP